MKRSIAILICCIFAVNMFCPSTVAFAEEAEEPSDFRAKYYNEELDGTTITVFNWGQYIGNGEDDTIDVIKEFKNATGINVNYITYDDNESMYSKLKLGGSSYDIVVPSDYMVERMIVEGMLEKLDFNNIPNAANIDPSLNTEYDQTGEYSVPYTRGTVGIIYNSDYVDEEDVGTWELLWNPKYADEILMFDNSRDAFAIALSLLGYDENTTDEAEINEAAMKLNEQKDVVQQYVMDQIFDVMEAGEAWIAPYYAGDYLIMAEENPSLRFSYPKEGYNSFIDAMCIPTSCSNKPGAEAFINFLCDPEISLDNCDAIGYTSPLKSEFFDEEMLSNEIIFPSQEVLEKSFTFRHISDDSLMLTDKLWSQIRAEESKRAIPLAVTVGLIAVVYCIYYLRKKRRESMY